MIPSPQARLRLFMTESHVSHNPWPGLYHGREKSLGRGEEKKPSVKPQIQDLLFGFGAVGVVHHHAAGEAGPHGLGCDQLQLQEKHVQKVLKEYTPVAPWRPLDCVR